jgi:hypothetical protein
LTIMSRARVLVVGALPLGLTLTVVTTARHLHADVFVFVVVSYLGVSTLSLHGLVQLEDRARKRLGAEDRDPEDGREPWTGELLPTTTDAQVVDFAARSRRSRQGR